ncbi:hypothetical protein FA13DRAFT_347666 [Coprinellus micaceus]|uniref:Uncharacterized protein n=1 Tax=Coprinellus micaceus TaxID=71717 RepID=A0A4Y7SER6_COPMI|nr:hypothetical protein FA13DRAFT_347666 [Coprinellus micaceus]
MCRFNPSPFFPVYSHPYALTSAVSSGLASIYLLRLPLILLCVPLCVALLLISLPGSAFFCLRPIIRCYSPFSPVVVTCTAQSIHTRHPLCVSALYPSSVR